MQTIAEFARIYHRTVAASLAGFPEKAAVNIATHQWDQKPPVHLLLPLGEAPDAYTESFARRCELLGIPVVRNATQAAVGGNGIVVDIGNRVGRPANRFPGVYEIQQAVVWLGLDYFVHIRTDSVRKTVAHFDRLMAAADRMADSLSRDTAYAIIADQLTGIPYLLPRFSLPYDAQYFGTGLFDLAEDEVVIDAGAANGDSLEKFAAKQPQFERYALFEPDPVMQGLIDARLAANSFGGRAVSERFPLAEKSGVVRVNVIPGSGNTHLTTAAGAGVTVPALSIDDYLAGGRASVLKMDVEGAEPALLRGAEKTIRGHQPKLLISIYHEVEHLFEVPEMLSGFFPGYQFHLRNHSWATEKDSWPGAFFCETVMYALAPKDAPSAAKRAA